MIETLILSSLFGLLGGMISYLLLNNSNNKYAKTIKINKNVTIDIFDSFTDVNKRFISIVGKKSSILISVKEKGIISFNYVGK